MIFAVAICLASISFASAAFRTPKGYAFARYNITAPGITASFIPYGARLTNLLVSDSYGNTQDVVLGYDDGEIYAQDEYPMGAVIGRYAVQAQDILDSETASSADQSNVFGDYDKRSWTLRTNSESSITFAYRDDEALAVNYVTYTVAAGPRFTTRLASIRLSHSAPTMLSNMFYWNLGGVMNPSALNIYSKILQMPCSARFFHRGQVAIGPAYGTFLDYTSPASIGEKTFIVSTEDKSGSGYDHTMIIDRPVPETSADLVVLSITSPETGIRMDVRTNKPYLNFSSCNDFGDNTRTKRQGVNSPYDLQGYIAFEWTDGAQEQEIYGNATPSSVTVVHYDFSVVEQASNFKQDL